MPHGNPGTDPSAGPSTERSFAEQGFPRVSRADGPVDPPGRARLGARVGPVELADYDTRLAAYALVVDSWGRLLLAAWNEGPAPQWTMPGGGLELEETPARAAVREVREETGYDVELVRLLGLDTHVTAGEDRWQPPGRPPKSLRVVHEGRVVGGELRNEVDGTTDEARWVPLSEVPSLHRVSLVDASRALWREAGPA